jgi:cytochrome bd-type quinol oxidase subunit 2
MEFAAELSRNVLVILHLVGMASLLGGFLTQMKAMAKKAARIVPAMVHGAWTALITGILLVGVAQWRIGMGANFEVDHTKIAVKSIIAAVILVLVITNRKKDSVKTPIFGAIGALTLTNLVLAVIW